MANLLVDFDFRSADVSTTDGKFRASFSNARRADGPGNTILGRFDQAVSLGTAGKSKVALGSLRPNRREFCIRVVFRTNATVSGSQCLVSSDLLPFELSIESADTNKQFYLVATLKTQSHGKKGPDTRFKQKLKTETWYAATLAYDQDTVALYLGDQIVAVHAFPDGRLASATGQSLYFGTGPNGRSRHYNGRLAAFQWYDGIPEDIESLLDERRSYAEWFVTYKYESAIGSIALGKRTQALQYEAASGMHAQQYEHGAIYYHDAVGAAFEMHGAIHARYRSLPKRDELGFLVSDEVATTQTGGKKSVFSRGAIYWAPRLGAQPVLGQLYLEYENLGESKALGFPTAREASVSGGLQQQTQSARLFYQNGAPKAHEVHGGILKKFLGTGGTTTWGFPVSNESDVVRRVHPRSGATQVVGKFSQFEASIVYWSASTGAFEVHGDIARKYADLGGPLGPLGFPTSDEIDIPGFSGPGRMNTFQNGSILWFGNYQSIIVATAFKIHIGRINSRESEGFGRGQNDLYLYHRLRINGRNAYKETRRPKKGDWAGKNIRNVNYTIPTQIVPNRPDLSVEFRIRIYDADRGNGDDHLGTYTKVLNAANAWGHRDNQGVYKKKFKKIRSLTWSVQPQVNAATLTETQKFWGSGAENKGTPHIPWQRHASAFRDVDNDTEWWDVTDWLDKAFYELVTDTLAKGGNCYGMSVEAIYARKNRSIFGLPIDRFNNWSQVEPEFNIKHLYQVGAGPIWWFLGQFVTGNTHDPKDVFRKTHEAFRKGNHPVLCLSQNYNFSGAPHAVLPVAWDSSSNPWKITICDPNAPQTLRTLTVNSSKNTFSYRGGNNYRGGEWSGGRLHYMPYSMLDEPPRTPLWDAILLLLAGTILILADDATTVSLTDGEGNDLNAFGNRAMGLLKNGQPIDEFFVPIKGTGQSGTTTRGTVASDLLVRANPARALGEAPGAANLLHLPIEKVLRDHRSRALENAVRNVSGARKLLRGRTVHHALADPAVRSGLDATTIRELERVGRPDGLRDFVHKVKGMKKGHLRYAVKDQLTEMRVESTLESNEAHTLKLNDLGTNKAVFEMNARRDKRVTLQFKSKLGVKKDQLKMTIDKVPIGVAKKLSVNLKPGLGGLELAGAPGRANVDVTLEAVVDGRKVKRSFQIPLEEGVRIKPAVSLRENTLPVSRIERLFGPVRKTDRIRGR